MSLQHDSGTPTRAEQDAIDVLLWLSHNTGSELSYRDIARGTGIPDGPVLPKLRRSDK